MSSRPSQPVSPAQQTLEELPRGIHRPEVYERLQPYENQSSCCLMIGVLEGDYERSILQLEDVLGPLRVTDGAVSLEADLASGQAWWTWGPNDQLLVRVEGRRESWTASHDGARAALRIALEVDRVEPVPIERTPFGGEDGN